MWEYTFDTEDESIAFTHETLGYGDWLYERAGCLVRAPCPPDVAAENAEIWDAQRPTLHRRIDPPTHDELVVHLECLAHSHDSEEGHVLADMLLLAYINDPAIAVAFQSLPRWYS